MSVTRERGGGEGGGRFSKAMLDPGLLFTRKKKKKKNNSRVCMALARIYAVSSRKDHYISGHIVQDTIPCALLCMHDDSDAIIHTV